MVSFKDVSTLAKTVVLLTVKQHYIKLSIFSKMVQIYNSLKLLYIALQSNLSGGKNKFIYDIRISQNQAKRHL